MIDLNKEPTGFNGVIREVLNKKETISFCERCMQCEREGGDKRVSSTISTKGSGGQMLVS